MEEKELNRDTEPRSVEVECIAESLICDAIACKVVDIRRPVGAPCGMQCNPDQCLGLVLVLYDCGGCRLTLITFVFCVRMILIGSLESTLFIIAEIISSLKI